MRVYSFRIELDEIRPQIWRQIQVPEDYTFWDFHVAIQDAMGWQDSHLHQFEVLNPSTEQRENIGIPDPEMDWDIEIYPGWECLIADYFTLENPKGVYTYDFGDEWTHHITLGTISPVVPGVKYPCCLRGERACPPEDVGGVGGYYDFVMIMGNRHHEDHKAMREWFGRKYYPEIFEPEKVKFSEPRRRLKKLLVQQ